MKGITPVVAIILLLLITISMVGFAFVWFSRVTQSAGEQIGSDINATIAISGQRVRVEAVSGTSVTLRSSGTSTLPSGSIALLVNGALNTSGSCPAASQAAGSVFGCTLLSACPSGATLRATAPSNFDDVTC